MTKPIDVHLAGVFEETSYFEEAHRKGGKSGELGNEQAGVDGLTSELEANMRMMGPARVYALFPFRAGIRVLEQRSW